MAGNDLAMMKKGVVDVVADRVRAFRDNGEINFPANYSPENAMKSAWLILQDTKNKDNKPALDVCAVDSVANALLDMVVQGLNPAKKQCYFIVYGNKLTMQRSYFGSMVVAKSVNSHIEDIVADVVYEKDVFKYQKKRGKTIITEHQQELENIDKAKIICAYATIIYKDGSEESVIMTMSQIKMAWAQSKVTVFDEKGNLKKNGTHEKFTEEMAKKTVINRACKMVINSSDDGNLLVRAYKQTADENTEIRVAEEIGEKANRIPLNVDLETGEIIEVAYKEVADAREEKAGMNVQEAAKEMVIQEAKGSTSGDDDIDYDEEALFAGLTLGGMDF